ncbi:MAG: hypothetical protein AB1331_08025 [Bacillota bacterium]
MVLPQQRVQPRVTRKTVLIRRVKVTSKARARHRARSAFIVAWVAAIGFMLLLTGRATTAAHLNSEIRALSSQKVALERRNEQLAFVASQLSSLARVEQVARTDLRMKAAVAPRTVLTGEAAPAYQVQVAAASLPEPTVPWWERVWNWLGGLLPGNRAEAGKGS